MLLYRCLMTIYIKSRGGQVLVVKQRLCHIFRKVILCGFSYMYPKLLPIQNFIWMAQRQHHTKAS